MIRLPLAVACVLAIAVPHTSFAEEPAPPPPAEAPAEAPAATPAATVEQAAEPPAPEPARAPVPVRTREIRIDVPGERTLNNKLVVGGVFAAGLVASTLGVYWHLDSRDASNAVSADEFTGEAWTDEKIALVDRADRSKTRAIVAYSIGGALLIGAVAAYIFTEPNSETAVIHTGVVVAPTPDGGGMVTKLWSF